MKHETEEVRVVYVPAEGQSCLNRKAVDSGFRVEKGQKVKVYGAYRKIGKLHMVSTCPSESFYIQTLPKS
jgi:hypothetical protein